MQNSLQGVLHGLWDFHPNYLAQHIILSFQFSDPTYLFIGPAKCTCCLNPLAYSCICAFAWVVLPTLRCPLSPSPLSYFVEFSLILHTFRKILKDSTLFEVCCDDFRPQEPPLLSHPSTFSLVCTGCFTESPTLQVVAFQKFILKHQPEPITHLTYSCNT